MTILARGRTVGNESERGAMGNELLAINNQALLTEVALVQVHEKDLDHMVAESAREKAEKQRRKQFKIG